MTDQPKDTALAERIEGKTDKRDAVQLMVDHHKQQFARNLTRPDGHHIIHPDKFARLALTAVRTTPKLAQATDASVLGALMVCAQLGLEPNSPLGQAYLVPFDDRKAGTTEATLIIGYQGYIDLMYRSDRVASVSADAVCEEDYFYFERGTNAHITHRPLLEGRGEVIAAYAIAELVSGAKPFEVLSKTAIEKRRGASKTDKIWSQHYEAMARKSAIRALFKFMPSSVEWQAAVIADGRSFTDIPERLEDVGDVIDVEAIEGDDQ